MSSVALVTASTSSIPLDVVERYGIHTIPFVIQFLDGNYREGQELGLNTFYQRLEKADAVPTTAPTSTTQYIQFFSNEFPEADTIIMFHIDSHASKSFENAERAGERITNRRIVNIDTKSFSLGSGLQIIEVAQALVDGASADDAIELAYALTAKAFAVSVPESVRYLRMSGRLGRLPAMAASLMGILPILGIGESGMDVLSKARSHEGAEKRLLEHIQEFLGDETPKSLGITHTNAPHKLDSLRAKLEELYPNVPLYEADAGPILAVHVGPGTVAIAALKA